MERPGVKPLNHKSNHDTTEPLISKQQEEKTWQIIIIIIIIIIKVKI